MSKKKLSKTAKIIEGLLFLAGDGINISDIKERLEVGEFDITYALDELYEKYEDSGITLNRYDDKIQFSTSPDVVEDVSKVLNPIRERAFSKSLLEVAAIIAYKQPVTKLEIEDIRGVSADYAVSSLLEQGIIEVVGKKETVGHPLLYGTTEAFLRKFNLQTISELPDFSETLEALSNAGEENVQLFNQPEGEELPDFLKDEEVVSV